jgi:DNA-binding transcriptional MocR family regulator
MLRISILGTGVVMGGLATIPKYEAVADRIQAMIDNGVYEPGERLPSIRELHLQLGVSINTVREAYRVLESRGAAEAVSKSGHFVRQGPPICLDADIHMPGIDCDGRPQEVSPGSLTRTVMRDAGVPGRVNLFSVDPPAETLPTRQIIDSTVRVLRRQPERVVGYGLPDGPEELRQAIAKRLFRGGLTVRTDDVLITAGCVEAVFLALATVCKPGDAVIVESPAFFLFYQLLEQLGLRAVEIPSRCCDGLDVEALESALEKSSAGERGPGSAEGGRVQAALLIGNFTNPMGSLIPDENKGRIAELLSRHAVYLIEDDMYAELHFGPTRPRSLASFADPDLSFLAASFSKTIAPGYRIGWLAGREHLIERARHTKLVTSVVSSKPAALGIAEFLENGSYDHTLRAARARYAENIVRLREAVFESFPEGTTSTRPEGGMMFWVALPAAVDVFALYESARAEDIVFAPGPMFSLRNTYRNGLRIGAVRWEVRVDRAVRRLGALATTLLKESKKRNARHA